MPVQGGGELTGVASVFHHADSREYLGHEVWQQEPLPAELSYWPLMKYFKPQPMMKKMLPRVKTLRIQSIVYDYIS